MAADWEHMRYALAVGRTQTISGAAKALKVDHTTVGRKLTALEDALATPLFVREPRRLRPTDAGLAVIATAERMEAAMLELERTLAARSTTPTGVVRVSTSEAFAEVLVRCLDGLRSTHPELRMEVLAGNRVVDLAAGEADLAIRFAKLDVPSLVYKRVFEIEWAVFGAESYLARRGSPESADTLAGHDFVGFEERMAGSPGARWITGHVTPERIVMRGDSLLAVRGAALSGVGLAPLPVHLARDQPLVRVLDEPVGIGRAWLVVHSDLRKAPHVRAVMDFIEKYLRDWAAELEGGNSAH